jgi:DNA invertase Pin-like site-specific DNA recombinase
VASTIAAWHEDLDVSGSRTSRPGLDAALARAENGVTEGIVVARSNRFARSLVGALELNTDAWTLRPYKLVSVAEGVDPSTSNGKMMQNLMLVLADVRAGPHQGLVE